MRTISIFSLLVIFNNFAMQLTSMDIDDSLYPIYYLDHNNLQALVIMPTSVLQAARDEVMDTLLHRAIKLKRIGIMRFLIENTGLTIVRNKDQLTPRELAKRSDDSAIRDWGRFKRFNNEQIPAAASSSSRTGIENAQKRVAS